MTNPTYSETPNSRAHIELMSSKPNDRRTATRKPTKDLSSLKVGMKGPTITCMVHNVSETGALIETSTRELPERFILDNPDQGIRKLCRVVWSYGQLTGVEFLNPADTVQ